MEIAHNDVITIVSRKDNPRLSKCPECLMVHCYCWFLLDISYRFENLQEVDSTVTYDLDTEVEATKVEAAKEDTEEETMDVTDDGGVKEEVDVGQKRKVQEEVVHFITSQLMSFEQPFF